MRRAQLIGIAIAVVAGGTAFFGMRSLLKPQQRQVVEVDRTDSVAVLVARTDISLGNVAGESAFRWQEWPRSAMSPSFVSRSVKPDAMKNFTGAIARAPILAGEPITENKLIKPGSGGVLAAILPAGMRAISTKIKEETAVGKLILPNDHVDVILTRRQRSKGVEETVSDTIFRNIRVLAIGQQIEIKEGKKNAEGNVATLELSPQQAELLAQANSVGEISLALRSIADLHQESGMSDVFGKRGNANAGSSVRVLRYGMKSRVYESQ